MSEAVKTSTRGLTQVLDSARCSLNDATTGHVILSNIQSLRNKLTGSDPTDCSQSIPFNSFREYVRQVLLKWSTNPQIVIRVSTLYVLLIRKSSLAYEELCLSTCIHHIVNRMKDNHMKSGSNTDGVGSGSLPHELFREFWEEIVAVVCLPSFDLKSPGFVPLVIGAFGDLLQYGRGKWFHELVITAIERLLDSCGCHATPVIYKALFPVIRVRLPAQNLESVAEVLTMTGQLEQNAIRQTLKASNLAADLSGRPDTNALQKRSNLCTGSKSFSRMPLLRFFELSAFHMSDRADQRSSAVSLFHRVLRGISGSVAHEFEGFMLKASRHPKAQVRLFALEYASVLAKEEIGNSDCQAQEGAAINVLASRISDRAPSVRIKAIASLTEALQKAHHRGSSVLALRLTKLATQMRARLRDAKSRVRKAAVDYIGTACAIQVSRVPQHANEQHTGLQGENFTWESTAIEMATLLTQRSFDSVSNVRLASILQMTEVVLRLSSAASGEFRRRLVSLWSELVLPHVEDVDSRCKEASMKAVQEVLLAWRHSGTGSEDHDAWKFSQEAVSNLADCFLEQLGDDSLAIAGLGRKAVAAVCKKGIMDVEDVKLLVQKLSCRSRNGHTCSLRNGVWVVLGELCENGPAHVVINAVGHALIKNEILDKGMKDACKVACALTRAMPKDKAVEFFHSLRGALFSYDSLRSRKFSPESIKSIVQLMSTIECSCCPKLLSYCEKLLQQINTDTDAETDGLLVLIGSVCASFALPKEPSQDVLTFVQALLCSSRASKTRALALATLGKICLAQWTNPESTDCTVKTDQRSRINPLRNTGELLTRRYVSIFVHELDNPTSNATRNNAVLALCDLCRQYTAAVEPYVARLVGLLSDSSDFIRLQVMTSIVSLLQEDYVKLRTGPMFYQLARCLLDPVDTVRTTAEYALLQVIAPKNPSILATSFVELIFVLNGCTAGDTHNRSITSLGGIDLEDFKSIAPNQRARIYDIFLQGMTLEQRFRVPGRLRSEILALVTDEKLSLDDGPAKGVISDTLQLIACEQVRILPQRNLRDDDEVDFSSGGQNLRKENNPDRAEMSKKRSLLAKVYSIELREVTVPALLELRQVLERQRSPLLKSLMRALCLLLRPHYHDLESIIPDRVLKSEVQHEINTLSNENRASKHATNNAKRAKSLQLDCSVLTRNSKPSTPNSSKNVLCDRNSRPMSVPRQKRRKGPLNVPHLSSDSEEEGVVDHQQNGQGRSRRLSMRIEASPKLAAIATRATSEYPKQVLTVSANDQRSSFALALARIEDAAEEG